MGLALEGIRVIDVSQVIAVPMGARHLGDFGADVIHIEHPQRGDFWRSHQAGHGGNNGVPSEVNYNWEAFNRNKRSVALDLSTERGREIIYRMVQGADVFVTNLRLYEREKFGVEYHTLREMNPRLIYGSITGLGKKGPERNSPAFDQTVHWYRSGVTHMLIPAGASAIGFRAGFGDTVAGLGLFAAVMTALYVRERTGLGQEVELSLFHTGMYQLSFDMAGALITGRDMKDVAPGQLDEEDPRISRYRELSAESQAAFDRLHEFMKENAPNPMVIDYRTSDDRTIHLNVLQPDRYWARFCQALARPELEHDPRFSSHESRMENHSELYHITRDEFRNRTLEEWKQRLTDAGIPFGAQQKLSEVASDPQGRANGYFVPFDHPAYGRIKVLANPLNLSETPASVRLPAPEFAQHTEEVLIELGYSWEDIARFKEDGVIA